MGQAGLALSVLIPVYNERDSVRHVVARVLGIGSLVKEVIVVDDGSTDGTSEILQQLATEEPRVQCYRLERNQGKTAAVSLAIRKATGELLVIQDADLEYDPAELPDVVGPLLDGVADVVYGSRFLVRRASRVLYFYHYLANCGLTFLSNLLTNRNMTDIETCYKAFRSEVIKPLQLSSRGFGLEVEITAMVSKTKARTYEVPISYYGRTYAEGKKIGPMDGVMALYYILFFNLVKPWSKSGRQYIQQVNTLLDARKRGSG